MPNFIADWEEKYLLSQIQRAPKTKWTQLLNRRVINYGGIPHFKGMIATEMPIWLQSFIDKVNSLEAVFEEGKKANHVLLNEYWPGQGIMAHTDGPLFHPVISTISLGSYTILEFHKIDSDLREDPSDSLATNSAFKLLLEPCSLLILRQELYNKYLHGISEIEEDEIGSDICNLSQCANKYQSGRTLKRGTRISLTIRHVPKTIKLKLCLV